MFDLPHIALGIVYLIFGTIGGFYSLKTLILLHKSPEVLKAQKSIWLPILVGTVFFTIGGLFHIAEHTILDSYEIGLLHELFVVSGISAFVIGVFQYSRLQMEYYSLKREGLKVIQFEEPLQNKPEQTS